MEGMGDDDQREREKLGRNVGVEFGLSDNLIHLTTYKTQSFRRKHVLA